MGELSNQVRLSLIGLVTTQANHSTVNVAVLVLWKIERDEQLLIRSRSGLCPNRCAVAHLCFTTAAMNQ